jgi:hypothetical protein
MNYAVLKKRIEMRLLRMILIALSASAAGVVVAHVAPLSCDEAREHLGEDATVCGLVASARYLERGSRHPTFLNLCKPYPNHVFTAVIWGEDREKFVDKFGAPEKLQGRNVCVTGKIELYKDKRLNKDTPEIIPTDPKQLEIREAGRSR